MPIGTRHFQWQGPRSSLQLRNSISPNVTLKLNKCGPHDLRQYGLWKVVWSRTARVFFGLDANLHCLIFILKRHVTQSMKFSQRSWRKRKKNDLQVRPTWSSSGYNEILNTWIAKRHSHNFHCDSIWLEDTRWWKISVKKSRKLANLRPTWANLMIGIYKFLTQSCYFQEHSFWKLKSWGPGPSYLAYLLTHGPSPVLPFSPPSHILFTTASLFPPTLDSLSIFPISGSPRDQISRCQNHCKRMLKIIS